MIKLNAEFLDEVGLADLPADLAKQFLGHTYETLEMRVGMKLASRMSNDQLDEFEKLIDANDESGALEWLETNFPDYKNDVEAELEKLKAEIRAAAPAILEDARTSSSTTELAATTPPSGRVPGEEPTGRAATLLKVQRFLANGFSGIELEDDGGFSLQKGSARGFVQVLNTEDGAPTLVSFTVPILYGVKDGSDLYEHIAFRTDDYTFGHLSLHREESGAVNVILTHRLAGDGLTEDVLNRTFAALLRIADHLDDELQARFGGERFYEDADESATKGE